MLRILKKYIYNSFTLNLIYYTILLLIGSIDNYVSILVSICGAIYGVKLIKQSTKAVDLNLINISIGNLLTYHVMVDSYAETLPWETIFHAMFYLISYYYYYYFYKNQTAVNLYDFNSQSSARVLGDFKQVIYIEKYP
jgi:hypothetical protein